MTMRPFCDGISRRDFVRLGSASLFGMSFTLPDLLAARARAAEQGRPTRDVSLIFLFLHGGLSTIDTLDLKPDAPAEFRGEFRPIDTNVPGVRIGEHLPRMARQMDKVALIRSFCHRNSDHGPADHYILTGYFPQARAVGEYQREAFNLMSSPAARRAFDIQAEPATLRDEYGRNSLGQSCLMARRLVEAGVRCVTIDHSNWDTHDNNFRTLREQLLPPLDAGLSALFRDLADRGLLDSTLVVVTGEFGRTPRINNNAGRDHWGPAFTVLLGGGGIHGGRVVGASDARAERPAGNPHGPEDLAATIYHLLGIDPTEEFYTPEGRPVPIVSNGRVIRELL